MRALTKRVLVAVATVVVLMAEIPITPALASWTNAFDKLPKGTVTIFFDKSVEGLSSPNGHFYRIKSGKVTKVKSSNTKVVTASVHYGSTVDGDKGPCLCLDTNKTGKAKVTYVYKGKKRTLNVVVKKWVNPIKKLKIGGKNIASKIKEETWKGDLAGRKIEVTPASGWELVGIDNMYRVANGDSWKSMSISKKNGGKLKKSTSLVYVSLRQKKTGMVEHLLLVSNKL